MRGVGLVQGRRDLPPGRDLAVARTGLSPARFEQQPLQAERPLPRGQRVVAHISDAAGPQLVGQQADDAVAHGVADPAPDAMQGDDIGLRQIASRFGLGERREIGLDEPRVFDAGLPGEFARGGNVRRVEVDPDDLPVRVAPGQHRRAKPCAAAKLHIADWRLRADRDPGNPAEQAGEMKMQRRLMAVIAGQIGNVGDIAARPNSRRPRSLPPPRLQLFRLDDFRLEERLVRVAARTTPGMAGADSGIHVFQPRRGGAPDSAPSCRGGISDLIKIGFTANPIS